MLFFLWTLLSQIQPISEPLNSKETTCLHGLHHSYNASDTPELTDKKSKTIFQIVLNLQTEASSKQTNLMSHQSFLF